MFFLWVLKIPVSKCGTLMRGCHESPPTNAGDVGWIPGSVRLPGEGNGNPFQYSYLENSMDPAAWWATVHGVAESRTQLSD